MTPLLAVNTVYAGVAVVGLFTFLLVLWALVAVLRTPGWAWVNAGKSKQLWIILLLVAFFLPLLGVLLAMICLIGVLPDIARQQRLGQRPGFPGGGHR